jgi:signal transduction histidine kinase/ActR/RegA family two-component response regulator
MATEQLTVNQPSEQASSETENGRPMERLLAAVLASVRVDELLQRLLEIVIDVGSMDVAVARLREGDRLRARAAIGVEEELTSGFSVPVEEALPSLQSLDRSAPLLVSDAVEASRSPYFREKGIRQVYCLPLYQGSELAGAIYGGVREARPPAEETRTLLTELMGPMSAALARCIEREALEQGIASRDAVLGVVAHDLRNPINVISLAAHSLMSRMPDPTARRSVERILRGAHRADRLVQDLLEVNTIEGGRFSIQVRRVETADTVLAALESQQSLAAKTSVIIRTDLSPALPPIEADPERVLEVLENLVGNAIKFTSAGGTVTVGASAREGEILFWVKDTGSGISPEQLPHLFDRFWQANKRDRRGTGMGLTICKAIVEAHGGVIWPEAKEGEGTTMFFTIPSMPAAAEAPGAPVANLLLVDDRPENLLSLTAILERPEYRLFTANSGEEALRLVLRERFSAILLDIAMPNMSGLEVAAHLKDLDRSRDIPIIFITAFGDDPGEVHRAYAAGGADYLVKPLDPEIVRKKVAVFVDLSRRRLADDFAKSPAATR